METKLYIENETKLTCAICGFVAGRLTWHVNNIHHVSSKDYNKLYPGNKLVYISPEQRMKASQITLEWFKNPANRELHRKVHDSSMCNSAFQTEYWIKKGCTSEQAKIEVNKRINRKKPGEETRKKLSAQRQGTNNSMSLENIAKRNGVSVEEAHKLTPCYGRTKEKHPLYGKHHSLEVREKMARNTPVTFFNKSKGEKELQNYVLEIDSNVHFNKAVGPYNCDIVSENKKIIIEYYGDFWHCSTRIFVAEAINCRLHCTAKERWEKDRIRKTILESLGYTIKIVWENDWKNNQNKTKEKICNLLK
jgi:G:T-mismatch repair DNA endonuclease (very short patch repair protein)